MHKSSPNSATEEKEVVSYPKQYDASTTHKAKKGKKTYSSWASQIVTDSSTDQSI